MVSFCTISANSNRIFIHFLCIFANSLSIFLLEKGPFDLNFQFFSLAYFSGNFRILPKLHVFFPYLIIFHTLLDKKVRFLRLRSVKSYSHDWLLKSSNLTCRDNLDRCVPWSWSSLSTWNMVRQTLIWNPKIKLQFALVDLEQSQLEDWKYISCSFQFHLGWIYVQFQNSLVTF